MARRGHRQQDDDDSDDEGPQLMFGRGAAFTLSDLNGTAKVQLGTFLKREYALKFKVGARALLASYGADGMLDADRRDEFLAADHRAVTTALTGCLHETLARQVKATLEPAARAELLFVDGFMRRIQQLFDPFAIVSLRNAIEAFQREVNSAGGAGAAKWVEKMRDAFYDIEFQREELTPAQQRTLPTLPAASVASIIRAGIGDGAMMVAVGPALVAWDNTGIVDFAALEVLVLHTQTALDTIASNSTSGTTASYAFGDYGGVRRDDGRNDGRGGRRWDNDRRGQDGRGTRDYSNYTCHRCHVRGHIKVNCPYRNGAAAASAVVTADAYCGSYVLFTDHDKSDVEPVLRVPSAGVPVGQPAAVVGEVLHGFEAGFSLRCDSGTGIHLSQVLSDFDGLELTLPHDKPKVLFGASGVAMDIHGYADMPVHLRDVTGRPFTVTLCMAYVPQAAKGLRLLAMNTLTDKGVVRVFDGFRQTLRFRDGMMAVAHRRPTLPGVPATVFQLQTYRRAVVLAFDGGPVVPSVVQERASLCGLPKPQECFARRAGSAEEVVYEQPSMSESEEVEAGAAKPAVLSIELTGAAPVGDGARFKPGLGKECAEWSKETLTAGDLVVADQRVRAVAYVSLVDTTHVLRSSSSGEMDCHPTIRATLTVPESEQWRAAVAKEVTTTLKKNVVVKEVDPVTLPAGTEEFFSLGLLKIVKGLYGLKQAPRPWYDCLVKWLTSLGSVSEMDACCFKVYRNGDGHTLWLLFWVDDLILSALKVLKYLVSTADVGLTLRPSEDLNLTVYTDVSYGIKAVDYRSVTGMCLFLGRNLIDWTSCAQKVVTRSSAEAEYVAMDVGMKAVLAARNFILTLGMTVFDLVMKVDNTAAIAIAEGVAVSMKVKHLDIIYHFLRDHVAKNTVTLEHCGTNDMVADVLTKPLDISKLLKFRKVLLRE